jgi:outer membrane protein
MKRLATIFLMLYAVLCVSAQDSIQTFKYGYLSYERALQAMPNYAMVQKQLADLRAQYEAEQQRVEKDFNLKYEEFLEGQRDFPETILRKRQTELKELLERNIAFKEEGRRQIAKAEAEALAPLKTLLGELLTRIGLERGYAFILNTDAGATPFLNPAFGEDVSSLVGELLNSKTLNRVLR